MDGLKPGRIVYFVLSALAVEEIDRRRTHAISIKERIENRTWPIGAQAHIGNPVSVGQVCPAMVLVVHGDDAVNLKVMLDGSDEYWARTVSFDEAKAPGTWHWMFEGQQKRYDPAAVRT